MAGETHLSVKYFTIIHYSVFRIRVFPDPDPDRTEIRIRLGSTEITSKNCNYKWKKLLFLLLLHLLLISDYAGYWYRMSGRTGQEPGSRQDI